ncbi:MAG: histidine phosphatase family protein [Nanoarchaeota archaeon]
MKEFIFVRHGETQDNKEGILQGHLDVSLNETGLKEAEKIAEHLRRIKFDAIFSSDLTRGMQCAQEIQKNTLHLKIKKDKLLREKNLGAHQGKQLFKDLGYEDNSYNSMVKHLYECKCPNGETNGQLLERIKKFLLSVNKIENKMVLVVTHGGVVMLLLNYLLKEEIKFENSRQHKNGYVSYLKLDNNLEVIDSLINVHVSEVVNYLKK